MTSKVYICNLALSHIGHKSPIASLTEKSTEAKTCSLHYNQVLGILLQSFPYQFSERKISLAEVDNDWPERYAFAYSKPSDLLAIRRILPIIDIANTPTPISYSFRSNKIYCDHSPARLSYSAFVDDPTIYPPLFVEAFSWALALRLSYVITKEVRLQNMAKVEAEAKTKAAQASDANNEPNTYTVESEFHAARL